jgi:hypothetical protein
VPTSDVHRCVGLQKLSLLLPLQGSPQSSSPKAWRSEDGDDEVSCAAAGAARGAEVAVGSEGLRPRAIAGVRVEAGAPQVRYGPGEGCWTSQRSDQRSAPRPVSRRCSSWIEPEPKRVVVWRRRWRCQEQRGLEQVHPKSAKDR